MIGWQVVILKGGLEDRHHIRRWLSGVLTSVLGQMMAMGSMGELDGHTEAYGDGSKGREVRVVALRGRPSTRIAFLILAPRSSLW